MKMTELTCNCEYNSTKNKLGFDKVLINQVELGLLGIMHLNNLNSR